MKEIWQRIVGGSNGAPRPRPDAPGEKQGYAQEFQEAMDRTYALGLPVPPIRLVVRKDCVDKKKILPSLQEFMRQYPGEQALGQAFAINLALMPYLYARSGILFTLTMGWFEHMGKQPFRHGEELLRQLLREGIASLPGGGLPLHVWLTSPACEVLDVTLMTTLAAVTRQPNLSGAVVYISTHDPNPELIYHPTVTGVDFLDEIGAAVRLNGSE